MTQVTDLQKRALGTVQRAPVQPGFGSQESFELMLRQAKMLAASDMVPAQYRSVIRKYNRFGEEIEEERRENQQAIPNCVIAQNMAMRMRADPLAVMQNLYLVEGRPSWSSQWIISAINTSGKFSPLRFEITDCGEKTVENVAFKWVEGDRGKKVKTEVRTKVKVHDFRCVAWVLERATGDRLESPPASIELAVKEGWYTKNGSKWQTMPEVMLRYRAAAFFGRLYAPELLMGIPSQEEAEEYTDLEQAEDGTFAPASSKGPKGVEPETVVNLRAKAAAKQAQADPVDSTATTVPDCKPDPEGPDANAGAPDSKPDEPSSEPTKVDVPTIDDAIAAVRSGDFDMALDLARGLAQADIDTVIDAINAAKNRTKPRRPVSSSNDDGFGSLD